MGGWGGGGDCEDGVRARCYEAISRVQFGAFQEKLSSSSYVAASCRVFNLRFSDRMVDRFQLKTYDGPLTLVRSDFGWVRGKGPLVKWIR